MYRAWFTDDLLLYVTDKVLLTCLHQVVNQAWQWSWAHRSCCIFYRAAAAAAAAAAGDDDDADDVDSRCTGNTRRIAGRPATARAISSSTS